MTGGGTRLGFAIVQGLLAAEFDVAAHYCTSVAALEGIERTLPPEGPRLFNLKADFTRRGEALFLAKAATRALGRIDLLVNSAAIMLDDDADTVELAKMKLINVDAPEVLLEALTDDLAISGGSVVNIADVAGLIPFSRHLSYSRSKAVLLSRTVQWALLLAERNVRVNAICPGTVLPAASYSPESLEPLRRAIPLRRFGSPEDIVRAVLFLANSPFVTGQVLCVDGGRSLTSHKPLPASTSA